MNKTEFLKEIEKVTGYNSEECLLISDVLDDTFIVGKKNKEKMIDGFMSKLGISNEDAEKLYEDVITIIKDGIKDKIKHPFKSRN